MKLLLGVLDVKYSDAHGVFQRKNGTPPDTSTGEVAGYLEDKYHIIEIFFEERQEKISKWMAEAISHQIADLLSGAQPNRDPLFSAMQKIELEFRMFLDSDEISSILPTKLQSQAAIAGVTHRRKSGYTKGNVSRPLGIDTGLYQASFRAWTDNFGYVNRKLPGVKG